MNALAVTVLGHDRPGIIAEVTSVLAELGGNLEDSSMTLLRGHFAMTLVVDVPVSSDEVEARLSHLVDQGLRVSVLPLQSDDVETAPRAGFILSVHGADRPGIVSQLTSVIAAAGGNITDLTTRLAGGLYVLVAEVGLPPETDIDLLSAQINATAAALGVGATLRPADTELL
jgi:glycine cleavage system transcriptional repressor